MTEKDNKSLDDQWLSILTGNEELDVTGQFLNEEQLHELKEAELLREALISQIQKEQTKADDVDIEKAAQKLLERLKEENLL